MATVSEVAVRYAAKGAQRVQRADRNVRESIQTTADTARQEQGTINRWMQRHQAALLAIGATTTAIMAGIIRQSPALSAQLAEVRLGFSLLAMTIGRDVAPLLQGAGEAAVDLADAYEKLPGPIRTVTSVAIFFSGIIAAAAGALGALSQVILGQSLAASLSGLASAIASSTTAAFAFAISIGALIGGIVVWLGHVTGVMGAIRGLGATIGSLINGPLFGLFILLSTILTGGLVPLMTVFGAFINGTLKGGIPEGVRQAQDAIDLLLEGLRSLAEAAAGWGADIIQNLKRGIEENVPSLDDAVSAARDAIEQNLSFDRIANDKMARRWGSDLVEEFSTGLQSARPTLQTAAPDVGQATGLATGGGGGGGGSNVTVILERGAVQLGGRHRSTGGEVDESEMAEEVGRVFDERTSGRGRL